MRVPCYLGDLERERNLEDYPNIEAQRTTNIIPYGSFFPYIHYKGAENPGPIIKSPTHLRVSCFRSSACALQPPSSRMLQRQREDLSFVGL